MTKTRSTMMVVATVAAMMTGCAAQSGSPAARANAVKLYASGASCDEIASKLAVDRDHARELIRTGIVDLNRRFYRNR